MTPLSLLFSLCGAVLCGAIGYRLLWRQRHGPTGVEGHYLRLCGTVVSPGEVGDLVYQPGGAARPFELATGDDQRYQVDPGGSQLVVHGRRIRVGDVVVVDATHSTVHVDEALYRESALRPALAALRMARGAWPELRWLNELGAVAAITVLVAAVAQVPVKSKPQPRHIACPSGTVAGGERGRVQWCEVDRGEESVVGAQESVKQGHWLVWWNRRRMRQIGWYEQGKPSGRWVTWHANGQKAVCATYSGGMLKGDHEVWWPNGKIHHRGSHGSNGRRDGAWRTYREDGALEMVQDYRSGRRHGRRTYHYRSGRLAYLQTYQDGVLDGAWRQWSADGKLLEAGTYKQDRKHGPWARWHESGKLARRGDYRDDHREGPWTFWHEGGGIMATGSYVAGEPDEHGRIHGSPDGSWRWWHDNGRMAGRGRYQAGEKQGRWIAWREDASMTCQRTYRDDEPIGHDHGECDGDEMAVLVGY